jgi:dihydrofolate reductase
VYSIQEALDLCNDREESFIIGGGSVYRQLLPFANKLYLTLVDKDFEADTFFPEIDKNQWTLVEKSEPIYDEANDFSYSFVTYAK